MIQSPDVLVFGSPVEDEITAGGKTIRELGGPAIYGAMAAAKTSARVALIGKWPEGFEERGRAGLAEFVDLSLSVRVPGAPGRNRLNYGDGLQILEREESVGLESSISVRNLQSEWKHARAALVPALGDVSNQLELVGQLRNTTSIPLIAVSFSLSTVDQDREKCVELLRSCDLAFLSLNEAYLLAEGEDVFTFTDRNSRCTVITLKENGAVLVSAGRLILYRAGSELPKDPTGAGDALAGAVIGALATGKPIEHAVACGVAAASHALSTVGFSGMAQCPIIQNENGDRPAGGFEMRVAVDSSRISKVASAIKAGGFRPFSFTEPEHLYPPINHPRALEYFFAVVMHQYGFWKLAGDKWAGSMYGVIDGERLKGSDFVWRSATKALLADREFLTEFLDDNGQCPLPMLESHREIAAEYGQFMKNTSPANIVEEANRKKDPVAALLETLTSVPGYREDPMRKKAMLLAMTLCQRPEKFLTADVDINSSFGPVVDYHVQRTSLRSGIILPLDDELRAKLIGRKRLGEDEELAVRKATFAAMNQLSALSGLSHPALDLLFFKARSVCPEMSDPECAKCPLNSACAHQKALFQPVFRTTAY